MRQLGQCVGLDDAGEHGRHEAANGLAVDDRITNLPRLLRHQAAPDGVALGPEVFALVVEAFAVAVDHHAQRHAVDARADAAVVQRRARVNGHHVGLRGVANAVGAVVVEQVFEQHALCCKAVPRIRKLSGRPLAALVLAPGFAQPFAVRFKAACGQHAAFGGDALALQCAATKRPFSTSMRSTGDS